MGITMSMGKCVCDKSIMSEYVSASSLMLCNKDKICRSEAFINDKKYKYILITNDICKDACCQMTDYSDQDWAKFIEWEAVFDFNPNTFKDGLGHLVTSSKDVLVKPCDISGT